MVFLASAALRRPGRQSGPVGSRQHRGGEKCMKRLREKVDGLIDTEAIVDELRRCAGEVVRCIWGHSWIFTSDFSKDRLEELAGRPTDKPNQSIARAS